jgi:hypothetical protein
MKTTQVSSSQICQIDNNQVDREGKVKYLTK